jgi:hypothetical protein
MTPRTSRIVFAALLLCASLASGQTPVTLFTGGQFVSYLQNGEPNAFGCLFTYASGTSTPISTYTDFTGVTFNSNPVVLTAGGTANVWMVSGTLYRVVVKTSGGVNCVSGSTVYTIDGINNTLLNQSNTWQLPQIFDDPISILASDLQIVFGSPSGTQTTLDVPPSSANFILHTPTLTGNDTLLSQNATQTVTNKNLTTGTELNGCGMPNSPGTYICIANYNILGPFVNGLVTVTGAPSQITLPAAGATNGVIGICVANCTTTGIATIQQSGTALCGFDTGTTAGDYVQIAADGYNCHDSGIASTSPPPTGGQIIGTVLSTNGGTGFYLIDIAIQNSRIIAKGTLSITSTAIPASVCAPLTGGSPAVTVLSTDVVNITFSGSLSYTLGILPIPVVLNAGTSFTLYGCNLTSSPANFPANTFNYQILR